MARRSRSRSANRTRPWRDPGADPSPPQASYRKHHQPQNPRADTPQRRQFAGRRVTFSASKQQQKPRPQIRNRPPPLESHRLSHHHHRRYSESELHSPATDALPHGFSKRLLEWYNEAAGPQLSENLLLLVWLKALAEVEAEDIHGSRRADTSQFPAVLSPVDCAAARWLGAVKGALQLGHCETCILRVFEEGPRACAEQLDLASSVLWTVEAFVRSVQWGFEEEKLLHHSNKGFGDTSRSLEDFRFGRGKQTELPAELQDICDGSSRFIEEKFHKSLGGKWLSKELQRILDGTPKQSGRLLPFASKQETSSGVPLKNLNWLGTDTPPFQLVEHHQSTALYATNSLRAGPVPTGLPTMNSTPTVDRFLGEIGEIVRQQDGVKLRGYLVIEPVFHPEYYTMIEELQRKYPAGEGQDAALDRKCGSLLQEASLGDGEATWGAFVKFMSTYLSYLRDLNIDNLWETFQTITNLLNKCNSALTHASMGEIMLPTAVLYCRILAKIALGLDKQPELIAQFVSISDDGPMLTLPERAANTIRTVFVTCLNDRFSGVKDGRPYGKKGGVYTIANIVLKMLFQSKHIRSAEQIFTNVYNLSPPLRHYPAAQRVTYLYYLGRFMWANGHFYRAALPLQSAFNQTPPQYLSQRRKILLYLLASNIILGRHPTQAVWELPEAHGFQRHFQPFLHSIRKGDLETFRRITDFNSENASWLLRHAIFLQLRHRCEVHVWRSLLRRTFNLSGDQGEPEKRRAPSVSLRHFHALLRYLEFRALSPLAVADRGPGRRHTNFVFLETGNESDLPQGYIPYISSDFAGAPGVNQRPPPILPTLAEAECIVASLTTQGFINGFISHKSSRFAIMGARRAGSGVKAGFPTIWDGVKKRIDADVPGWKRDAYELPDEKGKPLKESVKGPGVGGRSAPGPGMVINLSGARPVGST